MADVIRWVSKAGKAITMSTFDYIKELNPTIAAFGYAANDLKYSISDTVGNLKDKATSEENIKKSSSFVTDIMKNLKNDLSEANFRPSDDEFDDFDFGDDFGFDDESDYDEETSEADKNTKFTTDIMQSVASTTTKIISSTTAKSAQYMIKANSANTKAIMNTNIGIFEKVNAGLATINHNIINIDNFNRTATVAHYQNSVNFYVNALDIMKDTNSMLKEILDMQKAIYTKQESTSKSLTIDDIIDSDGVFNINAIKDKLVEDYGDMAKMFLGSGTGDLKSATKHPLQFLTKAAVSKAFPKMLSYAMQDFNTTLSGVASSLLMKMNNSNNIGLRMALSLLGLGDFGPKKSLNTGAYEKGAVAFDGITRKSIVEVIPTYLSKIYSAISGLEESRYDYEKGQFVTVDQLQGQFDKMIKDSAIGAASNAGIKEYFEQYSKALKDQMSEKQLNQLKDDFEKIVIKNFKDEEVFQHRDEIDRIKDDYNLSSSENAKIIKAMWKSMPARSRMSYASSLYSNMTSHNRKMRELENIGDTSLMSLFNNSIDTEKNNSLAGVLTKAQNNYQSHMMKYIQNIYDSVDILKDVVIEGYSRKKGKNNNIRSILNRRNVRTHNTVDINISNTEEESGDEEEEPPQSSYDSSYYENKFKDIDLDSDEYDGRTRQNELRDSIKEGYSKATSKKDKVRVFTSRAKDIAKHPIQFIAGMLNIAEEKLYDVVYGKDKEGNSVIDAITTSIKSTFEDTKKWIQTKVIEPLRKNITKENIHKNISKFFNLFGVDIDSVTKDIKTFFFGDKNAEDDSRQGLFTNLSNNVKKQFGGIFDYIKGAFGGVDDFLGLKGIKNSVGRKKEQTTRKINNVIDKLKEKSGVSNEDGTGEVEQAAEGIRKVKKTGAIIASAGEYILPPDMNPYNIAKRYKNENIARDKFISKYGGNPALFFNGGNVDDDNIDEQVKKWYEQGLSTEQIINKLKELKNKFKTTREDYSAPNLTMRMQDEMHNIINTLKSFTRDAKGKIPKKDVPEQVTEVKNDIMGNIKEYFPSMVTGGLVGTGVSLLTGMIGGPLLGAAAGASIGLLQKSDVLQRTLFGEKLADGTRDGTGKLPQKLTRDIYKYLPTMLKGATVGGILGITPLVPGGPLGGILLGSAVGFAQRNEAVQDYLFGEFGVLGKDFQEKVQHALPKMGFGALAGLVTGPFGVTTNILLGTALGFAADTELFKNTLFGEKGKDGKREGGIFEMIREGVVSPMSEFFKDSAKTFKDWARRDIFDPLSRSVKPISKQIELMMKGIFEFTIDRVKAFFGKESDGLFAKLIRQKMIDPLVSFTKGTINLFAKPIGKVISAPARAIGAVGDTLRRRQIRRGNATYMTAAERVAYREDGNLTNGFLGDMHNDRFAEADKIIANMSVEELQQASQAMAFIRNASSASKKEMNAASTTIGNTMTSMNNISLKAAKTVQKFIKDGKVNEAIKFINTLNISDQDKQKLIQVVEVEGKRYNDAKAAKEDVIGTRENMYKVLDNLGLKGINLKNLKQYQNLFRSELYARDPALDEKNKENDQINEEMKKEDQRHTEVMDVIREATAYLRIMSNPNIEERQQMYQDTLDQIRKRTENGEDTDTARRFVFDVINSRRVNPEEARNKNNERIRMLAQQQGYTETEMRRILAGYPVNRNEVNNTEESNDINQVIRETEPSYITTDEIQAYRNRLKEPSEEDAERIRTLAKQQGVSIETMAKKMGFKTPKEEEEIPETQSDTDETTSDRNGKKTIWQFVNGLPLKYFKTKDGDITPDTSHSQTKLNLFNLNREREAAQESNETQKSILGKLTSIPTMLGEIFSSGKDEKPGILKGLFSKALKVGGIATIIGTLPYLSKIVSPILSKFDITGDKIEDWLTKLGDKIVDGIHTVLFGGGKFTGLFPWIENEGWPWFEKNALPKISDYFVGGFDFLLSKVIPKAIELLIINIPDIAMGIIKGTYGMGTHLLDGLWNMFKKDSSKGQQHGVYVLGSDNNSDMTISSNGTVSSGVVSNDWELSGAIQSTISNYNNAIDNMEGNSSSSDSTISKGTSTGEVYDDMFSSDEERSNKASELVKLNQSSKSTMNSAITNYVVQNQEQLQEKISPILDKQFEVNGKTYSGAELLSSEDIVAVETDENNNKILDSNGNPIGIRGVDILSNPNAAKSILGIDIGLSDEEKQSNTIKRHAATSHVTKNMALDILNGTNTAGRGLSLTGKIVSGVSKLIPGIGWKTKLGKAFAGTVMGKGLSTVGNGVSNITDKINEINGKGGLLGRLNNLITGKFDNDFAIKQAESLIGDKVSSVEEANDILSYFNSRASGLDEAGNLVFDNIPTTRIELLKKNLDEGIDKGLEIFKSNNILNNTAEEAAESATRNAASELVEEGARVASESVLENTARTAADVAEDVVEGATTGGKKGNIFTRLIGKGISKVGNLIKSKMSDGTKKIIEKAKDAIITKIKDLFANSKIISYIQKALGRYDEAVLKIITKFGTELAEKVAEKFGENAAKNVAKLTVNLATWLTGPLNIVFMIAAFISGYNDANSTLGLTDTYSCSRFWKIIAGLVNVLNDKFLSGFVPVEWVVDCLVKLADKFELLEDNEMFEQFKKDREASQEEVEKYNDEHGTSYANAAELNNSKKLTTKAFNAVKTGVGAVLSVPGKVINFFTGNNKEEEQVQDQDTAQTVDINNQDVSVDYSTYEIAGSGSGIADKIAKINSKVKEQMSQESTNNSQFKYYTKGYNKASSTLSSNKSGISGLITNALNKIPNLIMGKFINPMEDWMDTMQEPVQELILDTFNKSFVTPMETLFSIFGKMITSISNSSIITTLIGDPNNPSDTGVLGQATNTNSSSSTSSTSLITKLKNTVSSAWKGIKKLFGKGSGIDTFVSQVDPEYINDSIGGMSVASQGCGPAAATMAINNTLAKLSGGYTNMEDEIGLANQYVANSGNGVTADYFANSFANSGFDTNYYQDRNAIFNSVKSGNSTVLLGQDKNNTSKSKSPFGPGNHYIVANGISRDGNTIYVNDPESNRSNIPYSTDTILKHTKLGISPQMPSAGRSALRIHRKSIPKKTYKIFYGGDAAVPIDGGTTDYVGKYTKAYESGSKGSTATDSCGADGGASFGSYQFIYSNEIPREFMKKYYPNIFNESQWRASVSNAKQQWLAAVKSDPNNFFAHEHEWAAINYYDVTKKRLKGYFDPDTHSRAIQDCIWSWSIHRGMYGAASDFKEACSNAGITNPQTCDETKLLTVCYDYRQRWFASKGYASAAKNRYGTVSGSERNVVMALKGRKPIDPHTVDGSVSTSTATAGTDGTSSTSSTNTFSSIFDIYNVLYNAFAKAFGFDTSSNTTTTDTTTYNTAGITSKGELSQKVLDFALQEYPNVTYVYGGTDEVNKRLDCSSFTRWVYKKAAGITLNRTAKQQHNSPGMKEIPFSQVIPGDILEFNSGQSPSGGHVGIYAGDNKVVHNAGTGINGLLSADLDSNGNRVNSNGSIKQSFYKAATIADQNITTGNNLSSIAISTNNATNPQDLSGVPVYNTNTASGKLAADYQASKNSGSGSGLLNNHRRHHKSTLNRNLISNEIAKQYKGGDSSSIEIYKNFTSSSSSTKLNDKTKLQAIKDVLSYLSSINKNTSNLTNVVDLLTNIIRLMSTMMENSSSMSSDMITAQKELINSMLQTVSSVVNNQSNNENDYQIEMLIKNVNNLISE